MLYIEGLERRSMKKFIYSFLFLSLLSFLPVKADEANISYQRLDGIYYNINLDGNFQSNHVTSFYLNDRIAYCIEPGTEINTRIYDVGDWSMISLSDDVKEYIEKVGYYGFEYPGHQNNYYYIAAQELIWKAVRPDVIVNWTTGINLTGDMIDISAYKNEIEELVRSHSLVPSFSLEEVSDFTGEKIVLEDTNGVLDNYDLSNSSYHEMVRSGNKLIIKLNDEKVETETITMSRKYYDDAPLLIYSRGSSQKLGALRITFDKSTYFTISNKEKPVYEKVIEVPNTGLGYYRDSLLSFLTGNIYEKNFS